MRSKLRGFLPLTVFFLLIGTCHMLPTGEAPWDRFFRTMNAGDDAEIALRPLPSPLPTASPVQSPLPTTGFYHGAFAGDLTIGMSASQVQAVTGSFEALAGKALAMVQFYILHGAFPTAVAQAIETAGALPVISLSPGGSSLKQIVAGRDDATYRQFAQGAKAHGKPLLIRWGWEMNGSGTSWTGYQNGANIKASGKYIEAWRHVVDLFRREGAFNVQWVWCVDAWGRGPADGQPGKWNHFENYYPGDAYVDWVGVDGYSWPNATYHTFAEIFDDPWLSASALSTLSQHGKPVMIGETASGNSQARSPEWIQDAFQTMTGGRYPRLKAVMWFNKDQDGADWKLKPDTAATQAYAEAVGNSLVIDRVTQ